MSILYRELTPDQRQSYADDAAQQRAAVAAHRTAIRAERVYIPHSAYMLYRQEIYQEVRAANPTAKPLDVVKVVGKQWQSLGEPERQLLQARVDEMKALKLAGKV